MREIIEQYSLDKCIYRYDFVGKWSHLIEVEELNTIFENLNQYSDDELDDDGYPLPSADENHAGWRRFNIEEFSVERANQELHNELEWLENNVGKFYDEAQ